MDGVGYMSVTSKIERTNQLLASRLRVPEDVVYRDFGHETIVLSLAGGEYHSVNATGGRMLETVDRVGSVTRAAALLAPEYGLGLSEIETDLVEFCELLVDRGLLVVEPA
jgi:coenzyme PQQ synthesis protein D (PqqD)